MLAWHSVNVGFSELWAEVLMNFCHGQKTSEILITLGKFLWSVLPPLTCGVHVGNCIVLSPQFCSSYFLNPLWALYHNATSRNTVSLFVTACHDSKNLAFFTMHFLQPYTRHKYTCYLQPHIYNLHSKTATFLPPNCLFCLLIFYCLISFSLSTPLSLIISHIPHPDDGQYLIFKANKLIQHSAVSSWNSQTYVETRR